MAVDADALVIGGGPAGASAAILLAEAGWRVVLVEQHRYPRQKVCGECIGAGNLALLDRLGCGADFRRLAGAELHTVGWMSPHATIRADLPACAAGPYRYGRALGRDTFDALLLERARSLGVVILQPARVRRIHGKVGAFTCDIAGSSRGGAGLAPSPWRPVTASLIIDAHGSWEAAPRMATHPTHPPRRTPHRPADLFAFKASFLHSSLASGFLPVLALDGGYGGMVVADGGRTTLACCIRRDALRSLRARETGIPAGIAVEASLRRSCHGIREALRGATRDGAWLSVGPLRPGIRLRSVDGVFRVGNAAGETHPLVGEGIAMALQSSALLADILTATPVATWDAHMARSRQQAYAAAWRAAFALRMRLAAVYAGVALRPVLARAVSGLLRRRPALLTDASRWAGKARVAAVSPSTVGVSS